MGACVTLLFRCPNKILFMSRGQVDFVELEKVALANPDPVDDLPSGSAELYEILLSGYIR
jgi:hypothetical protein